MSVTQLIHVSQAEAHQFFFKPMFCNVLIPHFEVLLRSPSTGNERGVDSGLQRCERWRLFLHTVKKCSAEGRSTGLDLQGLCQTGGYVWKQTDSPREIPVAVQTTFVEPVSRVNNNVVRHPSIFKCLTRDIILLKSEKHQVSFESVIFPASCLTFADTA